MGTGSASGSVGQATITPIYWAPAGFSFPPSYKTLANQFVADVAVDSGKSSNVFAVDTEYTNGSGVHLAYKIYGGSAVSDTDAYPSSGGCTPDSGSIYYDGSGYAACLTDAQI